MESHCFFLLAIGLALCQGFEVDLAERLLRVARLTYNDDFYSVDDYAANDDNNDDHYVSYNSMTGVDLTSYALKYVGCQNIHVWNSENAADSPLRLSRMVMLRLCEATGCSNYNAKGCQRNYAEYILPMDDYVEIMKDYHFEKLTKYCSVCADCMSFKASTMTPTQAPTTSGDDFYEVDDDGAVDDNNYQANSNYYNYGGGGRKLGNNNNYGYYSMDDAYANVNNDDGNHNSYPWYIDSSGQCSFSTVCQNYKSSCSAYQASLFSDDDASRADVYTSCTATNSQYIAPHCAADGHSIELAVYSDAYCSNYVQQSSSGYSLAAYSSKKCMLCNAAQSFSLISDKDIELSKTSSNPLCSAFYDTSAKCNEKMMSPYTYSTSSGYYDYNGAQTQVRMRRKSPAQGFHNFSNACQRLLKLKRPMKKECARTLRLFWRTITMTTGRL